MYIDKKPLVLPQKIYGRNETIKHKTGNTGEYRAQEGSAKRGAHRRRGGENPYQLTYTFAWN